MAGKRKHPFLVAKWDERLNMVRVIIRDETMTPVVMHLTLKNVVRLRDGMQAIVEEASRILGRAPPGHHEPPKSAQ